MDEKYTEYKREKEMKNLMNETGGFDVNFDDILLEVDDDVTEDNLEQNKPALPHSLSEDSIGKYFKNVNNKVLKKNSRFLYFTNL